MGPEFTAKIVDMLKNPQTSGNVGVKCYMKAQGLLITFAFNAALSRDDDNVLQNAAIDTLYDAAQGYLLKVLVGAEMAGPVGIIYTSLEMLDTVCYDENKVCDLYNQSYDYALEAKKAYENNNIMHGLGMQQLSSELNELAANAQLFHNFVKFPAYVAEEITGAYNTWSNTPNDTSQQVNQLINEVEHENVGSELWKQYKLQSLQEIENELRDSNLRLNSSPRFFSAPRSSSISENSMSTEYHNTNRS